MKSNLKTKLKCYLPRLPGDLIKLAGSLVCLPVLLMFITSFKPYVETIQFPLHYGPNSLLLMHTRPYWGK